VGALPPTGDSQRPQLATSSARVQHMERWLTALDSSARGARTSRAVWGFIETGVIAAGATVMLVGEPNTGNELNWQRVTLTGILLGIAAGTLTDAIVNLAKTTTDEDRLARWRALPRVDDVALARFEGELAAEAAWSRSGRIEGGVFSIGLALAGGAMIALTPTAELRQQEATLSYVMGTTLLAGMTLQAIMSLAGESTSERAYRLYESGASPEQAAHRVQAAPVLAAHGGGLAISGWF
jgi:hypothetical protein